MLMGDGREASGDRACTRFMWITSHWCFIILPNIKTIIFYSTSHATSTMTDDLTNLHPHSISKAFREIMATPGFF